MFAFKIRGLLTLAVCGGLLMCLSGLALTVRLAPQPPTNVKYDNNNPPLQEGASPFIVWSHSSTPGIDGYDIRRCQSGVEHMCEMVNSVSSSQTGYTDYEMCYEPDAPEGHDFYHYVRAVKDGIASNWVSTEWTYLGYKADGLCTP